MKALHINGIDLTLEAAREVAVERRPVLLDPDAREAVNRTRAIVDALVSENKVSYAITTGVGKLSGARATIGTVPVLLSDAAGEWRLKADVRKMVDFQEINLAKPWPVLPPLDLVLIRNVMIYFDVETKKSILGSLARLLRSDGYLLLGGAETTFNLDDSYQRVEPLKAGIYQLKS